MNEKSKHYKFIQYTDAVRFVGDLGAYIKVHDVFDDLEKKKKVKYL